MGPSNMASCQDALVNLPTGTDVADGTDQMGLSPLSFEFFEIFLRHNATYPLRRLGSLLHPLLVDYTLPHSCHSLL
ncbi:hypothetical protein WUBG_03492, partial [Wuchereria bancrofti]